MAAVVTRIREQPTRLRRLLWLLLYTLLAIFLMLLLPQMGSAGGPRYIAGISYFDPATKRYSLDLGARLDQLLHGPGRSQSSATARRCGPLCRRCVQPLDVHSHSGRC